MQERWNDNMKVVIVGGVAGAVLPLPPVFAD